MSEHVHSQVVHHPHPHSSNTTTDIQLSQTHLQYQHQQRWRVVSKYFIQVTRIDIEFLLMLGQVWPSVKISMCNINQWNTCTFKHVLRITGYSSKCRESISATRCIYTLKLAKAIINSSWLIDSWYQWNAQMAFYYKITVAKMSPIREVILSTRAMNNVSDETFLIMYPINMWCMTWKYF